MDNSSSFGPGLVGFAIFFALAIVLWLLMRNMNSRLRRMSYAKRDTAQQAAGSQSAAPATGGADRPEGEGQAETDDNASDAAT